MSVLPLSKYLQVEIHRITVGHPGRWVGAGWRDFKRAPVISLIYGSVFAIAGNVLTVVMMEVGMGSVILPLTTGFLLVAPLLVVGLYEVSRRLASSEPVFIGGVLACFLRNPSQLAVFGVVLAVFLVAWTQSAVLIFTLFFDQKPPPLGHLLEILRHSPDTPAFLMVGTAVGAVFAVVMFTITAVSVPYLQDRKADILTAITVSISATRMNWLPMIIWGGLIVFFVGLGLASMFLGLAVVLPVLAYGTWHSYEDMVRPREI